MCDLELKVEVSIMNTRCISMSEAVTVPSLMMVTSIVSEESLREGRAHTHIHTHARTHTLLPRLRCFFQSQKDFVNKSMLLIVYFRIS